MNVRFIGAHNAESKISNMPCLLINESFAIDAGSLVSGLSFSEQEKINAILLSHSHYDHIRDIPSFAFNNYTKTTPIYGCKETLDFLVSHFLDGVIYPKFTEKIPHFLEKPALKLISIEPFKLTTIMGFQVKAYLMNHTIHTVGFEITDKNGGTFFYTADTGPGLTSIWKNISPDVLIIDVTFPDRLEIRAKNSSHLTPKMLEKELVDFQKINRYLPEIYVVHLSPKLEKEIKTEIQAISKRLKHPIEIAHEGLNIEVNCVTKE
jgi:ribonuclease BN (tRNA processing enzyme)